MTPPFFRCLTLAAALVLSTCPLAFASDGLILTPTEMVVMEEVQRAARMGGYAVLPGVLNAQGELINYALTPFGSNMRSGVHARAALAVVGPGYNFANIQDANVRGFTSFPYLDENGVLVHGVHSRNSFKSTLNPEGFNDLETNFRRKAFQQLADATNIPVDLVSPELFDKINEVTVASKIRKGWIQFERPTANEIFDHNVSGLRQRVTDSSRRIMPKTTNCVTGPISLEQVIRQPLRIAAMHGDREAESDLADYDEFMEQISAPLTRPIAEASHNFYMNAGWGMIGAGSNNIDRGNKFLGYGQMYGGAFGVVIMDGSSFLLQDFSERLNRVINHYWEGTYGRMFYAGPT